MTEDKSRPDFYVPGQSETSVSSEAEIKAIGECCKALEPVARDKAALQRIYDYLHAKFPPRNYCKGSNLRSRDGRPDYD